MTVRDREKLAAKHYAMACGLAKRYGGHRDQDPDELRADALLGLAKAIDTWAPEKGCTFRTWAHEKIRSAVLDGMRQRDHLTRHARRRARRGAELRPPRSLNETVRTSDNEDASELLDLLADPQADQTGSVELQMLIDALPARDREALMLGIEGLTLREIGERWGISEARVCQMRRRARQTLAIQLHAAAA